MNIIEVNNITKDYGDNKGIFDVDFSVKQGEAVGFLGPNGAGKTTTIRNILGFIKPDKGQVFINGLDPFTKGREINKTLGYLPGENSLIDNMTGYDFIEFIAQMKKMEDDERINELVEMFELDSDILIKKMSKGMKQKIAIICAFMDKPDILILDEPTSGLDPLMKNRFIDLILEEKKRGATILMSSHIFEEVERTCDRGVIIKEGRIVLNDSIENLIDTKSKHFIIKFKDEKQALVFSKYFKRAIVEENMVEVNVRKNLDIFIKLLSKFEVTDINIKPLSLEELFMHYYGGKKDD